MVHFQRTQFVLFYVLFIPLVIYLFFIFIFGAILPFAFLSFKDSTNYFTYDMILLSFAHIFFSFHIY